MPEATIHLLIITILILSTSCAQQMKNKDTKDTDQLEDIDILDTEEKIDTKNNDTHTSTEIETYPPNTLQKCESALCTSNHCNYYINNITNNCEIPTKKCENGWCEIPAATFYIGLQDKNIYEYYADSIPQISEAKTANTILIAQTEVTIKQWKDTMGSEPLNSPFINCGQDCPVAGVTVFDTMVYLNKLSQNNGLDTCYSLSDCTGENLGMVCQSAEYLGNQCDGYRLPTELEWQFAAECGSNEYYWNNTCENCEIQPCNKTDSPSDIGWFCGNSVATYEGCVTHYFAEQCIGPHPVAMKKQNLFGLHDTSGNVAEITSDIINNTSHRYTNTSTSIIKGGSFYESNWLQSGLLEVGYENTKKNASFGRVGFRPTRTLHH